MVSWDALFDNKLFQILLIIFAALVLRAIVRRYISRLVGRVVKAHHYKSHKVERQREETLTSIFRTAAAVVIWLTSLILVLGVFEVNIGALLTGAGLLGVVIGFGAQNTIRDFVAGMFVIAENQYRIGDIVTLAGQSGIVESITIRVTRLRDLDGNLHIIPNGETKQVTNMTFDYANVNVDVGVSYDSDISKVEQLINHVGKEMARDPEWKEFITDPIAFLRVESFGDSAVTVKAFGEVAPGKQWEIAGDFRRRLKKAFEENEIEIPFPQRVIHTVTDHKAKK